MRRYIVDPRTCYSPLKHSRPGQPRPDPADSRSPYTCAIDYARLFAMMSDAGAGPRVITTRGRVLAYLNDVLGIRNRKGKRITRKMLDKWIERHGFPILRGIKKPTAYYPVVTMERAIDSWILSRPRNGMRELFWMSGRARR